MCVRVCYSFDHLEKQLHSHVVNRVIHIFFLSQFHLLSFTLFSLASLFSAYTHQKKSANEQKLLKQKTHRREIKTRLSPLTLCFTDPTNKRGDKN
jgi:hypothetical protein